MKPLPPVPFPAGPAFINLLPMRPSSLVVTSNQGLVNIVDTSNPTSANEFYQVLVRPSLEVFFALTTGFPAGYARFYQFCGHLSYWGIYGIRRLRGSNPHNDSS